MLESALRALDTLTKNDVTEVKGMKSPPSGVKLVLEAVCILKSVKPARVKDPQSGKMVEDYWEVGHSCVFLAGPQSLCMTLSNTGWRMSGITCILSNYDQIWDPSLAAQNFVLLHVFQAVSGPAVYVQLQSPASVPVVQQHKSKGCLCVMQASKKMLMETDFLQSLRSFDKDHIPVAVVQKIKPYIANPEFEPNKILTVSFSSLVILLSVAPISQRVPVV